MTRSVIVAGARTPIGKFRGSLAGFDAVDLGAIAIRAALERAGVAPEQVEYVIMGHVIQAGTGQITARQAAVDEVAERTVRVLKRTVPAAQPGVVFLSGGQSDVAATAHLNAMASMKGLPWPLTFSYSRALQNPALNAWKGQRANAGAAQRAFHHRARMNGLASQGKWKADLEKQAA